MAGNSQGRNDRDWVRKVQLQPNTMTHIQHERKFCFVLFASGGGEDAVARPTWNGVLREFIRQR